MEHSRCRDWHGKKVRVKMALAFSRRKLVWLERHLCQAAAGQKAEPGGWGSTRAVILKLECASEAG